MNKRETALVALTTVVVLAAGCFFAASSATRSPAELIGANTSMYSAEITSSTKIVKTLNSDYTYGFQLRGGENYGLFAQKSVGSIEVYDSGDYVISLKTNLDYIQFFLKESDSRSYKISDSEYRTLYAFPGLKTISVTVDKATTGLRLYSYSGAENCFDSSESVNGNLRTHTLTRNSTPLSTGQGMGNRIMIENKTGANEPVEIKIRSISLTYSC